MSEVLLQTIIEKLESLEIALLKDDNADKDETIQQTLLKEVKSIQSKIEKLPSQCIASSEKMDELLKGLSALNLRSDNHLQNQIKHSHHLHKGIWVSVGLFIISLLLLYGWIDDSTTKRQYKANDIKYRFLKVNGNANLLKLLNHTDSLYNLNPGSFIKQTVEKEQYLIEQRNQIRIVTENKKDVKTPKKKVLR